MELLWIGAPMLASWAITVAAIAWDVRRERRAALDKLNSEYQALCEAERTS